MWVTGSLAGCLPITVNWSVCTKWGVVREPDRGDVVYLTDLVRLRAELPNVRDAIRAQDRLDRPALIILDERGVGLGVYQKLRRAGFRQSNVQATLEMSRLVEINRSYQLVSSLLKEDGDLDELKRLAEF